MLSPHLNNTEQEGDTGAERQVAVVIVLRRPLDTGDGRKHVLHVADGGVVLVRVVPDLHHEHDEQHEHEARVKVGYVEGGAEAADQRVRAEQHGHGEQRELVRGVAREGLDGGAARQQNANCDHKVRHQGETAEHDVCAPPEPRMYYLQPYMESSLIYITVECSAQKQLLTIQNRFFMRTAITGFIRECTITCK